MEKARTWIDKMLSKKPRAYFEQPFLIEKVEYIFNKRTVCEVGLTGSISREKANNLI